MGAHQPSKTDNVRRHLVHILSRKADRPTKHSTQRQMALTPIEDVVSRLAAPLIAFVVGESIKRRLDAGPKLITYIGHISGFSVKAENPQVGLTHSVVVKNTGRKPAVNVRLSHQYLPENITVHPPVKYSVEPNGDGRTGDIVIPRLVPTEEVAVTYLYFPPLTWRDINLRTKSDEGFAKVIEVFPTPRPEWYVRYSSTLLSFVGASWIVYWIIRLALEYVVMGR